MSANESFDIDLAKAEKRQLLTEEDEDNLDEFVGQLQDAFHFAKQELPEELVYVAIEKTFKELGHATINFAGRDVPDLPGHIMLKGDEALTEDDIVKGAKIEIY